MKEEEILKIDSLLDELKRLKEENKHLKKQLTQLTEPQLHFIAEHSRDVLWQVDKNLKFVYISKAFDRMMGYPKEKAIGKHLFSIMTEESQKVMLHQDEQRKENERFHIETPENLFESEVLNIDGKKIWTEVSVAPIYTEHGEFNGFYGISRNISDRKKTEKALRKSEKRLNMITENMLDIISQIDLERKIVYISPSVERLLGYVATEVIGQNILSFIHSEDIDNVLNKMHIAMENQHLQTQFEFRVRHKYGEYLWLESKANLIYDENGHYIGSLFGTRIVDERKKYEQKLLETTKELQDLNTTKDKFFSIIAHDLKNPFNLITGFSELLKNNLNDYDKDTIASFVNTIHDTSKRGYNLLLNLLDWSRAQSGRIEYKPQRMNINNVIYENVDAMLHTAETKQIEILADMPESMYAFADIYMINTVLRNLISNAIKFSYKGGTIRVKTRKTGPFIEVLVIDKGKGISKEDIKKLFRLDVNHTSNGTANEKGTGLGLIICKEFVERCKGKISIDSEPEKGTTFRFTLPEA